MAIWDLETMREEIRKFVIQKMEINDIPFHEAKIHDAFAVADWLVQGLNSLEPMLHKTRESFLITKIAVEVVVLAVDNRIKLLIEQGDIL